MVMEWKSTASSGKGTSKSSKSSKYVTGPDAALRVELRRKLNGNKEVGAFKIELEQKLEDCRANAQAGTTVVATFHELDIAQNPISSNDLCDIFTILSVPDVRVVRMRLFGCASMDDDAAMILANWFAACTPETSPLEVHLSDCALTAVGFLAVTGAIRDNDAFPPIDPEKNKKEPMYLRIENNYIDQPTLKDIIAEGTVVPFTKKDWGWGSWGKAHFEGAVPENTKVKMLTGQDKISQQKSGDPPSPDQAGPYKNVIDWKSGGDSRGWKGGGFDGKGYGKKGSVPWTDASAKGYGWDEGSSKGYGKASSQSQASAWRSIPVGAPKGSGYDKGKGGPAAWKAAPGKAAGVAIYAPQHSPTGLRPVIGKGGVQAAAPVGKGQAAAKPAVWKPAGSSAPLVAKQSLSPLAARPLATNSSAQADRSKTPPPLRGSLLHPTNPRPMAPVAKSPGVQVPAKARPAATSVRATTPKSGAPANPIGKLLQSAEDTAAGDTLDSDSLWSLVGRGGDDWN